MFKSDVSILTLNIVISNEIVREKNFTGKFDQVLSRTTHKQIIIIGYSGLGFEEELGFICELLLCPIDKKNPSY